MSPILQPQAECSGSICGNVSQKGVVSPSKACFREPHRNTYGYDCFIYTAKRQGEDTHTHTHTHTQGGTTGMNCNTHTHREEQKELTVTHTHGGTTGMNCNNNPMSGKKKTRPHLITTCCVRAIGCDRGQRISVE